MTKPRTIEEIRAKNEQIKTGDMVYILKEGRPMMIEVECIDGDDYWFTYMKMKFFINKKYVYKTYADVMNSPYFSENDKLLRRLNNV